MNKSKIEWTECTWNPITGCTKVSLGCENCYAEKFAYRLKAMGNPRYVNGFNVCVHEDIINRPFNWKKPRVIFVNSMSDLFHDDVPDKVILQIFDVMNKCDWHVFQVLTKRSKRLRELSSSINWTKNIWMGVSIESNNYVQRAEDLKRTGAIIKFISAEPLLEDLGELDLTGVDWLIVGGESGPSARKVKESWILNLQQKANENNVAFFFKQWGGRNKKKNGAKLLGIEYKEYPKL